jgi:hypothetical protein
MLGSVCAHSPYWLGNNHSWIGNHGWLDNRHRKRSRFRHGNRRRNCFPSWSLVSYARAVHIDSVIVTESSVVYDSEIINSTPSTADVGIGQRKQTELTQKLSATMSLFQLENHHQNCFPSWCLDLSMRTIPVDSVIVTKNRVADAFEIVDETASPADAWLCMRAQSLLTR